MKPKTISSRLAVAFAAAMLIGGIGLGLLSSRWIFALGRLDGAAEVAQAVLKARSGVAATTEPADPGPVRVGGPGRLSWSRLGWSVSWPMPDDARAARALTSQYIDGERGTFGQSDYDPGRHVQTLLLNDCILYAGGVAYHRSRGATDVIRHRYCELNDRGGLYITQGPATIDIPVIPPVEGVGQADLFIDDAGRAFDPRTQRPDRIEAHLAGDTVLIWSADETDAADETDDPTGGLTGPAVRR